MGETKQGCNNAQPLIVLGIILLALLALSSVSDARTITVGHTGGADYWNIQDAINAANDSDIIQVWYGTYNEHIVINRSLIVESRDGISKTFIDAMGSGVVVAITSDNVTFEGFTVQNGEIGIQLTGNNSVISDNSIRNIAGVGSGGHAFAVYLHSANRITVKNNTIANVKGSKGSDGSSGGTGGFSFGRHCLKI